MVVFLTDFLDVNVWLALSVADHPHHEAARRYWYEQADEQLAFCRVTALGLLRLSTNATVMAAAPLSVAEAWQAYRAFRALPEVVMAYEDDACETALAAWVSAGVVTPRLWTDAYLAALAHTGGYRLVSFDKDYARFTELNFLNLKG